MTEEAHFGDAGDPFGNIGVKAGKAGADLTGGGAQVAAEEGAGDKEGGQDNKGDEGELEIHPEHDADDQGQGDDIAESRDDARAEEFADILDIAGDAGDEAARGILLIVTGRQARQLGKGGVAHIGHDLLPDHLHLIALPIHEEAFEGQGNEEEEGKEAEKFESAGDNSAVDRFLDQPGLHEFGQCQNRQHSEREPGGPPVGVYRSKEALEELKVEVATANLVAILLTKVTAHTISSTSSRNFSCSARRA